MWQLGSALTARGDRVRGFIPFHLFEDRAAALICRGQPLEMTIKVTFNLTLSLCEEAQVQTITQHS